MTIRARFRIRRFVSNCWNDGAVVGALDEAAFRRPVLQRAFPTARPGSGGSGTSPLIQEPGMTPPPVLARVLRGVRVESRHRGGAGVVDGAGRLRAHAGEPSRTVVPAPAAHAFPRL